MPWPPDAAGLLRALAAGDACAAKDPRAALRRAFRTAALRWHPDRWARRGGDGAVRARVAAVAQALNDAWAREVEAA